MPPKRKKKKKPEPAIRCDELQGERFHAPNEDIFQFNWWEIFCFPYILCTRFWDCLAALCSGTNQCIVYWMAIQWLVCKITQITTPDPILFPYYFYMFCQVILLTTFFVLIWMYFGQSVFIPFFKAFYILLVYDEDEEEREKYYRNNSSPKTVLRKYCFKKSEIFETPLEDHAVIFRINPVYQITATLLDIYISDYLLQ